MARLRCSSLRLLALRHLSSRALIKPGFHSPINKINDSITLIEHIFKRSKENMYAMVGYKELTLEKVEGQKFVGIATSIVRRCKSRVILLKGELLNKHH